jgi:hypothetical protein
MSEICTAEMDSSHCKARDTQSINTDYTDSIINQVRCCFSKGKCQLISSPATNVTKTVLYTYVPTKI